MKRFLFLLSFLLAGASLASGQQFFLGEHYHGGVNGGCPVITLVVPADFTAVGSQVSNCGTITMIVPPQVTVSPSSVPSGTIALSVPPNFTVTGSPVS